MIKTTASESADSESSKNHGRHWQTKHSENDHSLIVWQGSEFTINSIVIIQLSEKPAGDSGREKQEMPSKSWKRSGDGGRPAPPPACETHVIERFRKPIILLVNWLREKSSSLNINARKISTRYSELPPIMDVNSEMRANIQIELNCQKLFDEMQTSLSIDGTQRVYA